MTLTFASGLARMTMTAALCALVLPVHAADVKPAANTASQPKTQKTDSKKSTAKPTQGTDSKTVNNNPTDKSGDGGNVLGGKKPSGPRFPEAAVQPAATK